MTEAKERQKDAMAAQTVDVATRRPGWPGRPYPTTATGRMEAARKHTTATFADRNELLRVLAAIFPAHIMPVARGPKGGLVDLDRRAVLCIHVPEPLAWVLDQSELEPFADLERLSVSHWKGATRADRSALLAELVRRLTSGAQALPLAALRTLSGSEPDAEPVPRRRPAPVPTAAPAAEALAPAAAPLSDRQMHLLRLAIRAGQR